MKINANKLDAMYLRNDEFNEQKEKIQRIFKNLVLNYGVYKCNQFDTFICDCRRFRKEPPYLTIGIERVYYSPICPHCKKTMYKPEELLNQKTKKRYQDFLLALFEKCDDIKELKSMSYGLIMNINTPISSYLGQNPEKAIEAKALFDLRNSKKLWED